MSEEGKVKAKVKEKLGGENKKMNTKKKLKSNGLVAVATLLAVAVVAVLLAGTASAYYPERAGTVGYWHFDEGGGSVAYDSSGEGNDGTIYGARVNVVGVRAKEAV